MIGGEICRHQRPRDQTNHRKSQRPARVAGARPLEAERLRGSEVVAATHGPPLLAQLNERVRTRTLPQRARKLPPRRLSRPCHPVQLAALQERAAQRSGKRRTTKTRTMLALSCQTIPSPVHRAVNKRATLVKGSFKTYLAKRQDLCYLIDEFLEQGAMAATPA